MKNRIMTWKEKHELVLNNKDNIIKAYQNGMSVNEIAAIYKISGGCVYYNIRNWNKLNKKHGIKYLLKNLMIKEWLK